MSDGRRSIRYLLTAWVFLAIVGAGVCARAQDDEDEEAPAPVVNRVNAFVVNDFQFDQWVFGSTGAGNAARARNKVESLLTLHVEELERTCSLTPVQKKKLLLAGRGDMKRFFDRVDEVRKKYTNDKNFNFQAQFQKMWQEIQPLQSTFNAGLFGDDSIYAKAMRATLTPQQAATHEEGMRDRTGYRYWARVDLAMELLNNEVGFTDDQRRQLVKLLHEETTTPRKLGQQDYYVVLFQLGRIPEAKLKPIFEDVQWGLFKRQLDTGRRMERQLKQNGFVPGDEPEAKAKASGPAGTMPAPGEAEKKKGPS
jgi:hypothetical protein